MWFEERYNNIRRIRNEYLMENFIETDESYERQTSKNLF